MIEIELDVFNLIFDTVIEIYPDAFISNRNERVPAAFPCVTVEQTDNNTSVRRFDSSGTEKTANVYFEINVYHNGVKDSKQTCKSIMNEIDESMVSHGFNRTSCHEVPNISDSTIFRMTARYSAEVSREKYIYWR